jgi:hypothetical protein
MSDSNYPTKYKELSDYVFGDDSVTKNVFEQQFFELLNTISDKKKLNEDVYSSFYENLDKFEGI